MRSLFSAGNCYKQLLYDHFALDDCKGDDRLQLQPTKSHAMKN